MIWYLLYPFRGTTEAPVLPTTHPLRIALTRYGRYTARHVLATLLVSVAVASTLIYPLPFLYTTDFTIAAPNLPLHVWTDAQPLGEKFSNEADVIMRSIWVHGSYMKALDREVLLGALELQDEILGPTTNFAPRRTGSNISPRDTALSDLSRDERDSLHVINGLTNQSWFFHSPLQYWACNADEIKRDVDVLSTVNEKKTQPTSVNVTLRHSIVFSGKSFEDRQLVAADTLVITLLHLRDSPVGRQWERKTTDFVQRMAHQWDVFPTHGISTGSQLYEFQFRPISTQDTIFLSLAYVLTAGYFLLSLSKIRAVKSRLGLMVTVVVQIVMAIVSSLTVCALCRIDLSRIPRASYPLVLMAMSLENVFRLINAVILTPADHSTSSRIGSAFGETGHIALASVVQNLLILWGLSTVVVSGVSAFCTFAAIAILFDFFYLSTFFLSVLSVDVRRTELTDALQKAAIRNHRPTLDSRPWQSLLDAVLKGRIALSTRLAGTFVMLGFVVMAQWHFFDIASTSWSPFRLLQFLWRSGTSTNSSSNAYAGLHQARSPKSWLRLQDHETAKEVIHVVKPWAHSYVARVYDPVIFVLKGSDRNPPPGVTRWFPDVAYDFAHHQSTPFLVTVLFAVACVRLLMNYLLWDEMAEARGEDDFDEEPLISIKSLEHGHELDIVKMVVAPDGQIISVGLDRRIRVWNLRFPFANYVLSRPESMDDPFPILALAVDKDSTRLAILTTYRVFLWSLIEQQWEFSVAVELYGQKPEAFFFAAKKDALRSVVIVRRNGTLTEVWPDTHETSEHFVCKSPLSSVVPIAETVTALQPEPRLSLMTLSRHARIYRVSPCNGSWVSRDINLATKNDRQPHVLLSVQRFSAYMVARAQSVDLVDLHSSKIMHTFMTEPMQSRSLQFVYSGQRLAPGCRGTVSSLTLAYNSAETGECIIQTYLPDESFDNICFSNAGGQPGRSSCTWTETRQITRRVSDPGSWTPLRNGSVVGVRRAQEGSRGSPIRLRFPAFAQSGMRRRGGRNEAPPVYRQNWEIWVMTRLEQEGNLDIMHCDTSQDSAGLIISELGPMVKVGHGSVAVAFGNIIKVVNVGHECYDDAGEESLVPDTTLMASRRRKGAVSRTRASSTTFRYSTDL